MAGVIECVATVTGRGQTTVPAAIRQMLHLGKRDTIVFRGMADGTVTIARKGGEAEEDPVLVQFLAFLAGDMAAHPEAIRPVSGELVARIGTLVRDVEVDLESALPDDEE